MRFNLYARRGLVLVAATCLVVLYLALQQKLGLYIHPRYELFTVILCTFGLAAAGIAAFWAPAVTPAVRSMHIGALALVAISVAVLVVPRHVPLSSSLATQRGINTTVQQPAISTINQEIQSIFANNNYTKLTVPEWAGLLKMTDDPSFFSGKRARVSGFITPDPNDSKNRFYVSRFVITCCAVDAQPIGVPIHMPNWQQRFAPDQWVEAQGEFKVIENKPAIIPSTIHHIPEPKDPYVAT